VLTFRNPSQLQTERVSPAQRCTCVDSGKVFCDCLEQLADLMFAPGGDCVLSGARDELSEVNMDSNLSCEKCGGCVLCVGVLL
jgi:hypothetical protein